MALMADAAAAKGWGVFSWTYNRANFKYDSQQQWNRFTAGRKFAIAQTGMFRDDLNDLTQVAVRKLKTYGPVITMCVGNVVTCFVQGRSGLKVPGPPVFLSGVYYQCLAVGFSFMILSLWLVFHAALRAQVCAAQLRTRKVRVPVPTQRQLDSARKFLSTFEEENVYDQLKMPFVMPNRGRPKEESEDDDDAEDKAAMSCLSPKKPGKGKSSKASSSSAAAVSAVVNAKLPGITQGQPGWMEHEMALRDKYPKAAPSGQGLDGPTEPYEHFELIRQAQKEWWCAEAYMRVTFLYGMMHLTHGFAYWLVIHTLAEQGAVWCANICAAALTAAVWIMFRLDVLPDFGGCVPVEAAGPFVAAATLAMMYQHGPPSEAMLELARFVSLGVIVMHLAWTFRLYMVAHPVHNPPGTGAREAGGRLFNENGSCERPAWLPSAFQHVMYLVAPPKCKAQLEQEEQGRQDAGDAPADDPMLGVDMTPWHFTRTLLFMTAAGWSVLLVGRIVDIATGGERMLVTNPGSPPWTRAGMWEGWEMGPVTSKKKAHVTPVRGHFAWHPGWGPQGQQQTWPSVNFGFSPEADAYWSEASGPEPLAGAAGFGENTWARGPLAYGDPLVGPASAAAPSPASGFLAPASGGSETEGQNAKGRHLLARPAALAKVKWPALVEPELLLADPDGKAGSLLAMARGGAGAVLALDAAAGQDERPHESSAVALSGLPAFGPLQGLAWGTARRLLVTTGTGNVAACRVPAQEAATSNAAWPCETLELPLLPAGAGPAAVLEPLGSVGLRAAVALGPGRVVLLELAEDASEWQGAGELLLPGVSPGAVGDHGVVSISGGPEHLLLLAKDGTAYTWKLKAGRLAGSPDVDVPTGPVRSWLAAAALPGGRIARLAEEWSEEQVGMVTRSSLLFL